MGWALIMFVALAASVIGVLVYQMNESKRKSAVDTSGFNLSLDIDTMTAAGQRPGAPAKEQSSLQMIGGAPTGMKFGAPAGAATANLAGSKRNTDVMNKMQGAAQGMGSDQK